MLIAPLNNYLLPLRMIIFGIALVRDGARYPGIVRSSDSSRSSFQQS